MPFPPPPPESFGPPEAWLVALAVCGAAVAGIAAFHGKLTRTAGLSGPMVALAAGVAAGPAGLGWVDPLSWGTVREVMVPAALVTLAVGLTGVALRLPRDRVLGRRHLVTAATLLGPGMLAAWGTAAGLAWLALGADGWAAGLIGAAVVPTDPVLAGAIVGGPLARETLPRRLRDAIAFESGANDGLAVPLVTLSAAGLAGSLATAAGRLDWFVWKVLWEVGGALALGAACGRLGGRLLTACDRWHDSDETGTLAFGVALTLAVLGAAGCAGVSGPLAVFAAGLAFAWRLPNPERREEAKIEDAVNEFFLQPVFLLLGAALPWGAWAALGWRGAAFAALALLLKRPAWVPLFGRVAPGAVPDLPAPRDRWFAGWFGPVGVAALYYAAEYGELCPLLWPAVSLTVACSVVAHGATAAPLTRRYAGS